MKNNEIQKTPQNSAEIATETCVAETCNDLQGLSQVVASNTSDAAEDNTDTQINSGIKPPDGDFF